MIDRVIRTKECCAMVQFTNTHLRRLEEVGKFPPRFRLAEGSGKTGACGWKLSVIQDWIDERAATAHVPAIILLVVTYGFIFVRAVA